MAADGAGRRTGRIHQDGVEWLGFPFGGVGNDRLGTAISGLIGVLVTFGIGLALFALLRALRSGPGGGKDAAPTRAP